MCFTDSEHVESDTSMSTILSRAHVTHCPVLARLLICLQLCGVPTLLAQGQSTERTRTAAPVTGRQISGQVQDRTGAVIPGATIELLRTSAGVVATAVSDGAGHFRIQQPTPGEYRLAITLPGFELLLHPLRIGQAPLAPINLTMNLAAVSTVV